MCKHSLRDISEQHRERSLSSCNLKRSDKRQKVNNIHKIYHVTDGKKCCGGKLSRKRKESSCLKGDCKFKVTLRKWHLRNLRRDGSKPGTYFGEAHSGQRKQPMPSPHVGYMLAVFEEPPRDPSVHDTGAKRRIGFEDRKKWGTKSWRAFWLWLPLGDRELQEVSDLD